MFITPHMHQSMSKRGISKKIVNLVYKFGIADGDKLILNKKGCQKSRETLKGLLKTLSMIESANGYVVLEKQGDKLIAYRLDSSKH